MRRVVLNPEDQDNKELKQEILNGTKKFTLTKKQIAFLKSICPVKLNHSTYTVEAETKGERDNSILKRNKGTSMDKKIFHFVVISFAAIFISFLIYDFLHKDDQISPLEPTANLPETLGTDLPEITRDVYTIGVFHPSYDENFSSYKFKNISVSEALAISEPSIFIIDFDDVDSKVDRIYYDLVESKHAVLFTGLKLKAEEVVPLFGEKNIPVVPIEGTLPTFFQGYGAMYSIEADGDIPIFFGTNLTDTYDVNGLIRTVDYLEELLPPK